MAVLVTTFVGNLQAEEAAECERATADELLALLKEKEREALQLRCACLLGSGMCWR